MALNLSLIAAVMKRPPSLCAQGDVGRRLLKSWSLRQTRRGSLAGMTQRRPEGVTKHRLVGDALGALAIHDGLAEEWR
jgi:hypothetical protein